MRTLKLKINDKDYKLSMTRESIKYLEGNGFILDKFEEKPITYYEILFASLFIANHKEVNPNLAIKLMDSYEKEKGAGMLGKVIKFAIEEYTAFIIALADIDSEIVEDLEIVEE